MGFKRIYLLLVLSFIFGQTYPEIGDVHSLDIITWNIENFPKSNQTIDHVSTIINADKILVFEMTGLETPIRNVIVFPPYAVSNQILILSWYGWIYQVWCYSVR